MRFIFFWVLRITIVSAIVLNLQAQALDGITQSINCSTLDGWVMKFNSDGSASISYG
jgi:hypothetical protein